MNPRINVRNLPSPQRWGVAQPGMSWHHIIPFAVLRNVWNPLVDQHISTQLPEARTAIHRYLALVDPNVPNIAELVNRMRAENTDQRRASHHDLRRLDVVQANQLMTAATWPAWNTIEGPSRRTDDPKDRYLDRFTAGVTAEETARMKAIERIYGHFQRFADAGPAPPSESLRDLAKSISEIRPNLYCEMPIRYRPEMWVQDGGGFWRKRRDGEPYIPAR